MKTSTIPASALLLIMLFASFEAYGQIGPDLRPPGLDENHPVNSYTKSEKVSLTQLDFDWELNAGDVIFSAAKKRQLITEAPSTIHVITDKEITLHGWRSLAEILRHIPGVQTMTTKSQFQSVMIRGLVGTEDNNSRILWLQDGVPMNDVRDSGIWIDETYPVEIIKRIEIVLGPGSALYGSGAFQGVINIYTKTPEDINKYGEYRVALSNNLTFKASATAAYKSEDDKFSILGHVSGNTTQGPGLIGDFVFTKYAMDQAAQNLSSNLPAKAFRYEAIESNSEKHWYDIRFKLHYDKLMWNIGFTDIYAGSDGSEIVSNILYDDLSKNKVSGDAINEGNYIDPGTVKVLELYKFNRREVFNDFIYEDVFTDSVRFLATLSYRFTQYEHENFDPFAVVKNSVSEGNENDASGKTINTYQHKIYALGQVNWKIYDDNELIGGLVLEYHRINTDDFSNGDNPQIPNDANVSVTSSLIANRLAHVTPSVFLQDEQRFWDNRIILTLGGRFDAYRIYLDDDFTPKYAPSGRFAFLGKWTEWMIMRLSYGYAFKMPSLAQLYTFTSDTYGNPNLVHENLHNIELSFLFTPAYFLKLRLNGFYTLMDNLIIMQNNKNLANPENNILGRFTPKQDGGATITGFEFSLDATLPHNWNLYTHYNFLYSIRNYDYDNSIESSISKRVPDDAMHRLRLGASYSDEHVRADLAWFLVAGSPLSISNDITRNNWETGTYAIFQPEVAIALPANFGLMIQGSYAFSEGMTKSPTYRYYYEKQGVPVPRYSAMITLQYPFAANAASGN